MKQGMVDEQVSDLQRSNIAKFSIQVEIGLHIEMGQRIDVPHRKLGCNLMYLPAVSRADSAHSVFIIIIIVWKKW